MTDKKKRSLTVDAPAEVVESTSVAVEEVSAVNEAPAEVAAEEPAVVKDSDPVETASATMSLSDAEIAADSELPAVSSEIMSAGQDGPATAAKAPAAAPEPQASPIIRPAPVSDRAGVPVADQFPTDTTYLKAGSTAEDDNPEYDDEKAEYMNYLVIAHFLEDMKGCVTLHIPFEFTKHSQWQVPRWFAIQYPKKIVIRG